MDLRGTQRRTMNAVRAAAILGLLLGIRVSAWGVPVIGQFDWNAPNDLEGWASAQSWVHLSNPNSGGIGNTGYLNISLDPTAPFPGEQWSALATVDAQSLFAGNWGPSMAVDFQFWAEDVVPGAVQVQWQGSSGHIWRYTLTGPSATHTWTEMTAPFSNWQNWVFPGATEEMYLSDLASIDWIGIYVYRNTSSGQSYGLDDFRLLIPEPEQYALLAAVGIVILLAVRRRRRSPVS